MIKYLKNTKGMSLVELMVVAAIMVIIGLGIATMMQNAYRAQRGIDAKDNQRDAVARIRNLLNNKLACLNTISPGSARNISTVPFTLTQLRDESNVASFAQGVLHESGTLAYDRYEFYAQSTPSASIPTERIINLRLWLNKQGDITGPRAIRTEMKVKARLDASNRIIECIILGEDTESFWQQTPTNQSNIHYSGGNVGILNNNPREALEVTGN
ncbi:MAG: type II secretion system protein J, partial [Pseudobdellovibrio sp.]